VDETAACVAELGRAGPVGTGARVARWRGLQEPEQAQGQAGRQKKIKKTNFAIDPARQIAYFDNYNLMTVKAKAMTEQKAKHIKKQPAAQVSPQSAVVVTQSDRRRIYRPAAGHVLKYIATIPTPLCCSLKIEDSARLAPLGFALSPNGPPRSLTPGLLLAGLTDSA